MNKNVIFAALSVLSFTLLSQNGTIGINIGNMDRSVDPKSDFYQFANGTWLKNNVIPSSEAAYGSFNEISDRNNLNLKKILEEAAANKSAAHGTNLQKIGTLYSLMMDTMKLEKEGAKPLAADIAMIKAIKTKDELISTLAKFHSQGISAMFGFHVDPDLKNSTQYSEYFSQSGTSLPDKSYYTEEKYAAIREEFKKHLKNLFVDLAYTPEQAAKNAEIVFKIESDLASKSMGGVELRNIETQYNVYNKESFHSKYPNVNLDLYLKSAGIIHPLHDFIVSQPAFFENLNLMLVNYPISDWQVYLNWKLIHTAAPYLGAKFEKDHFAFFTTVLSGVKVHKPRWKVGIKVVDDALGDALGQIFVERHFNGASKVKVNTMVDNLTSAYKQRINGSDWMSAETKIKATEKLSKFTRKLGFPEYWKDYTSLEIKNDALVLNLMRANKYSFLKMIDDIGKPVDKTRWEMSPPTVNAYYNPFANEIVFPAGIMQPPFFDGNADDAYNYGIMGAIIGHELSHGFDDEGAKFDGDGNLKNWWLEEDIKKFKTRTDVLVDQFNNCIAVDSTHVNGELTLGENIADIGGLTMAYYAYKISLNGKKSEVVEGFTGEQRFFISWAQGWKSLMRPAFLKQMVATNPHSPGNFRATMPLTNMPEFYDAFGVTEKDKMYRPKEKRVAIW